MIYNLKQEETPVPSGWMQAPVEEGVYRRYRSFLPVAGSRPHERLSSHALIINLRCTAVCEKFRPDKKVSNSNYFEILFLPLQAKQK